MVYVHLSLYMPEKPLIEDPAFDGFLPRMIEKLRRAKIDWARGIVESVARKDRYKIFFLDSGVIVLYLFSSRAPALVLRPRGERPQSPGRNRPSTPARARRAGVRRHR